MHVHPLLSLLTLGPALGEVGSRSPPAPRLVPCGVLCGEGFGWAAPESLSLT